MQLSTYGAVNLGFCVCPPIVNKSDLKGREGDSGEISLIVQSHSQVVKYQRFWSVFKLKF